MVFGQVGEKIKAKIGQETCILQVPGTCYRCCKKISNLKTGTNIPCMFWASQRVILVYWQVGNFSATDISWGEQVTFQWDDDDVHFVLDQHAYNWIFIVLADCWLVEILLDLNTLWSWFWANQSLVLLFNKCMFSREAANTNLIVFGRSNQCSNPQSTVLESSRFDPTSAQTQSTALESSRFDPTSAQTHSLQRSSQVH